MAVGELAGFSIVNSVAVAEIQTIGRAQTPDRVLRESCKLSWERGVNGACVDPIGDGSDDFGATALPITGGTVSMRLAAVIKNTRPKEKVMDEGIDSDHRLAGIEPTRPIPATH